jgi:hypothetical protein
MNLVFNQKLSIRNGTEFLDQVGAVKQIHCLSLGGVFAAVWDHKVIEEKPNGVQNGENTARKLKCPPVLAMFRFGFYLIKKWGKFKILNELL